MKKRKFFKFYTIKSLAKHLRVSENFLIKLANGQNKNYKLCKGVMIKNKSRDLYVANYSLNKALGLIDKKILNYYDFPETFQGGLKGRSLKSNAKIHTNKKYILKIDISNFFPSIAPEKIYNSFRGLKMSDKCSKLLTVLTTVNEPLPHLPQGYCTSPKIASLVLLNFEKRLHKLFVNLNSDYSFWIDDVTFSSNMPINKFKNLIIKILNDEGYQINKDKVELLLNTERMVVTGVVVNKLPNITKERREEIKKQLYGINKFGAKNYLLNSKKTNDINSVKKLRNSLLGSIHFTMGINRKLGISFKKIFLKIDWDK